MRRYERKYKTFCGKTKEETARKWERWMEKNPAASMTYEKDFESKGRKCTRITYHLT